MGGKMSLNKIIQLRRKRTGLTIKQAAEKLGVPASTYRDWEYGAKIPALALLDLSKLYKVSILKLLGEEMDEFCPHCMSHYEIK